MAAQFLSSRHSGAAREDMALLLLLTWTYLGKSW